MIVLKILLIILLVILGLILLVLILPVGGEVSFIGGKLDYKVRLWVINIMDSKGGGVLGFLKKRKKKKKKKPQTSHKPPDDFDLDLLEAQMIDEDIGVETLPTASAQSLPSASEDTAHAAETTAESADTTASSDDAKSDDSSSEESASDEEDDGDDKKKKKKDKEKTPLTDKIDFVLATIDCAWSPLKRIFKGFRFSELYIDFILANEDAYKCAIGYGRFCGIFYNGLALLSRIFTVRLKTVDVQPGFGIKKSQYDASLRLDFRAGTVVIAGLAFGITFLFKVLIPTKLRKRKAKKSAAVQK